MLEIPQKDLAAMVTGMKKPFLGIPLSKFCFVGEFYDLQVRKIPCVLFFVQSR